MTPEHTDMTGAARLREALEDLSFAKDRIENDWSCHGFHEDGCPRCEAHRRLSRAARGIREALAAVPEAPEPPAHDCEAELKARRDYDMFCGTPKDYVCSCGQRFVYCDDEAEGGAWWERVEEGTER